MWHSPDQLAAAAAQLGHPDRNNAEAAVRVLKQAEATAVPWLLYAIEHGSWEARLRAIHLLAEIADEVSLTTLAALLRDPDLGLRREVAAALPAAGVKALPVLLEALRDWDWNVRSRAAEALGRLGAPEAVPALARALADEREPVRLHAARALGVIAAPAGAAPLERALQDDASCVTAAAAEALAKIGTPGAIPALLPCLSHPARQVRQAAATALTRLGWQPRNAEEQASLALATGEFTAAARNRAAIPVLCRLLRDEDWDIRRQAADSLAQLAERDPVPQLRTALPVLRSLLGPWPDTQAEPERTYERARQQIEAATAAMRELPLPLTLRPAPVQRLPVPAGEVAASGPVNGQNRRGFWGCVPRAWARFWKAFATPGERRP